MSEKIQNLFFASTSEVYGNNPKLPWNENDQMLIGTYDSPRWDYAKCKSIMENYIIELSKKRNFSIFNSEVF